MNFTERKNLLIAATIFHGDAVRVDDAVMHDGGMVQGRWSPGDGVVELMPAWCSGRCRWRFPSLTAPYSDRSRFSLDGGNGTNSNEPLTLYRWSPPPFMELCDGGPPATCWAGHP